MFGDIIIQVAGAYRKPPKIPSIEGPGSVKKSNHGWLFWILVNGDVQIETTSIPSAPRPSIVYHDGLEPAANIHTTLSSRKTIIGFRCQFPRLLLSLLVDHYNPQVRNLDRKCLIFLYHHPGPRTYNMGILWKSKSNLSTSKMISRQANDIRSARRRIVYPKYANQAIAQYIPPTSSSSAKNALRLCSR